MIGIENTLVSDEIFERKFVCDLNACKGACCVEGDSGAPLEENELQILKDIYETVKPYIPATGIEAIEKQGVYIIDSDGDYVTPLVEGKHCAYTYFESNSNIAKCAIEKACLEGKIDFKKPISCHLYPIRIVKTKEYELLNYNDWSLCKAACINGEKLMVSVIDFLKEPLIRKYGSDYFNQLKEAEKLLKNDT